MRQLFTILFTFFTVLVLAQNQKSLDSLEFKKIITQARAENDSLSQLKGYKRALKFAIDKKYDQGIYDASHQIAKWKKAGYNSDSAVATYKNGIKLLNKSNPTLSKFLRLIGGEFTDQSKYDSAQFYFNRSINLGETWKNNEIIADGYMRLGTLWHQQLKYDEAFKFYSKSDSVLASDNNLKSSTLRAQVYNYLGYCVRKTGGYEKAIEYYLKAKEVHEQNDNEIGVQEANIAIAQAYISFKKYDQALSLLNESIAYHKEYQPNRNSYTYGIIVRGFLYVNMKEFKKAEEDYKLYHQIAIQENHEYNQLRALGYLAYFYNQANQLNNAISNYQLAIDKSKALNDLGSQIKLMRELTEVYEKQNNYKEIVDYYKKIALLEEQQKTDKIAQETRNLETKYQTEKKEQEIALLKSEKELNEQKRKSQRNLLLGGIGLTSMAGLFLFFLYRNRQKTNTKLKELDRVKSNFFANISHEFRTPLTLINNPLEAVLEDKAISKEKKKQFTVAKQNSERLLSLVNQLLDLSKIDAGQLKLRIQKSNPIEHIAALSESFNYSAKQKHINYSVNAIQNNEQFWFDKDALEKITVNLVSNAIKYTPENGSVICNASITNNHISLEVKNTGKGLTKDQVNNIFQRFYQTNEDNQGTGIGLALVKELVDLHKGSIVVESIPNGWTSFTVALPIDKSSFKNEHFVDTDELNPTIKTVTTHHVLNDEEQEICTDNDQPILLIVEDNADVRILLKQTFEASYNILAATNGEEGIELAIEHIPDIIVSDIMMPVKDGIELTRQLKNNELTSHIPIILLTAKAGEENELKGIKTGADDYITKPFSSKILITKVAKLIESRALLQKRYSQEVVLTPKDFAITDLDEQFLNKVQAVLEENLVESSFSVTDFSEAVGMSRMQLHRKLKALTGLSASEFIRSQRLKLAAQLLKESDINISQVGYSVGFNDHSYFAKCFKDAYKCTPTEYAKRKP